MIGKYQAYPEYKDSGVEWLGNTPTHWEAKQLKFLCTYNDEALPDSTNKEYEVDYVDIGSVSATDGISKAENMVFENAPSRARRIVRDGDVIISTVRTYLEAIAAIDNPPENLIVSTGFAVIRPNQYLYKGYAAYCLRANGFIKEVVARSVGVSYPAINASDLVNIKLPKPELEEQQQIASFLDHETAKIDTLIDKQQQLIQLLKEKRQAVISHAVTKGLNPNAPMRDSGVEWLGEVPEHWKVGRYKFCTSRVVVGIAEAATHAYAETGVPIIRSTNIREEGLDLSGMLFIKKGFAELNSSKYLYTNDVITVRTGYPGTSAVIPETLDKSQCFTNLVATPKEEMSPHFLSEYLNSHTGKSYFDLLGWGSAQKNISVPILQNISIAWPEISEQKEIVSYIQQQREQYTKLVTKGEKQIELLQERRTALISAAVTGKIDVRHHVSRPAGNDTSEVSA